MLMNLTQTALVPYRAKSKFCEGFKLVGCGGVVFMDSVPALWVHAGDMCEPGAAALVLTITGRPRKSNARLSAPVQETARRESIQKLTRRCYWSLEARVQRFNDIYKTKYVSTALMISRNVPPLRDFIGTLVIFRPTHIR
jgi:hypothetical protein